jgi:hypothetical protein
MNYHCAADRYTRDPEYHHLVDMMESMIVRNQFTPSEMREAAVMASINYENHRVRTYIVQITPELHKQLSDLNKIVNYGHDS